MNNKKTLFHSQSNAPLSQLIMAFLAIAVGIVAGFGAVLFRGMIGLVHNIFFLGKFSFVYDANVHTLASPWGLGVILVPVVGGVLVTWLVKTFAPETRGHGVPEVMYAIYMKEGKIRPIVAAIKALASSISIGSGGSVGREGPIVQIGSTFGSVVGSIINMPAKQRNILVAAGAAGGIAATFNTPIGALAFAIELMLTTVDAASIFVVIIATVVATYIGRAFLGVAPSFYVPILASPNFRLMPLSEVVYFIPFGIIIGFCAILFIQGLYWMEDLFEKWLKNLYLRSVAGMLLIGITLYVLFRFTGHYYVQGVGYATIVDVLKSLLTNPWFLLLLVALKMLSTFITLGSGASGGIFSPLLFIGATLGAALGIFAKMLFPGTTITPIVFAISGMAGMVGGATGAIMTSVIMVLEMTRDNYVVLPLLITVGTAYIVRKLVSHSSIYTLKLLRRGEVIPEGLHAAVALAQQAQYVMNKNIKVLKLAELESNLEMVKTISKSHFPTTVVATADNKILGVLRRDLEDKDMEDKTLEDLIAKNFALVASKDTLPDVVRELKAQNVDYALVSVAVGDLDNAPDIVGIISKEEILQSSQQAYSLY